MIRLLLALACVGMLTACASSPEPRDTAARDQQNEGKPAAVFSHIEIGGGY